MPQPSIDTHHRDSACVLDRSTPSRRGYVTGMAWTNGHISATITGYIDRGRFKFNRMKGFRRGVHTHAADRTNDIRGTALLWLLFAIAHHPGRL